MSAIYLHVSKLHVRINIFSGCRKLGLLVVGERMKSWQTAAVLNRETDLCLKQSKLCNQVITLSNEYVCYSLN